MRIEISNNSDKEKRKGTERRKNNKIQHQIHKRGQETKEREISRQVEEIDDISDSCRCFKQREMSESKSRR